MIFPAFRRKRRNDRIAALYGAIVAQARSPAFYRSYGVADTPEGRLELILLHAALVIGRLAADAGEGRRVGQGVFDAFCGDMEHNLREMGVGDLAVPRQMRRLGEAYYGRAAAYRAALASGDRRQLVAVLAKNIFSVKGDPPRGAQQLASYVEATAAALAAQDPERAPLQFPELRSPAEPSS
jgi:cytochrome b pre-mRNA-processing protein 3